MGLAQAPTGTVTFLFTDIEGSTKLWEAHPEEMRVALARHDALMREAIGSANGHVFRTAGDAFYAAFATAPNAVSAALAAQLALASEPWPKETPIRARMALHTGAVESRDADYFGQPLNRVARLLATGHGGQTLLSQTTCDLTSDFLPDAVSLRSLGAHRLKDLQAPEQVYQLLHDALHEEFPPLRSLDYLPTNLPRQISSFVGRQKEIAEVKRLVESSALVTLTGSGGSGKTRLGLQVAADLVDAYSQGVWLVELGVLSDTVLVPQAVASAFGLREERGRTLTRTLTDYLKEKALLLVLDNCEHLLDASAELADLLLRNCPRLVILATSRRPLNIPGETAFPVPPLSPPDPAQLSSDDKNRLATLLDYDAVHLFVERAREQDRSFALTYRNASSVAELCRRLDGIPLAIELAAARVRAMGVEQITERLNDRFRLLAGGGRTAPPRHKTLRAALDWSYDLLPEEERLLLSRISGFAGGWTLEAAEAICSGEGIAAGSVLNGLVSLVDQSLVLFDEAQGPKGRYRMLETIRQYGRERLEETGESGTWRGRHRDWFLALVEEANEYLAGPDQSVWSERLEWEHDNLREALRFCIESGVGGATSADSPPNSHETGLRLCGALLQFWEMRGYLSEGREWSTSILSQSVGELSKVRADALNGAGVLAYMQGDYAAACHLHDESLCIRRTIGDRHGIAASLNNLGSVANEQGHYACARSLHEESLDIRREIGDRQGMAWSLNDLGNVALEQGDYGAARVLHAEGLALKREIGDRRDIAGSLGNLGLVAYHQGDYAAASALQHESLGIYREMGDRRCIAESLDNLSLLSLKMGDLGSARASLWECAQIGKELGDKRVAYEALEGWASLTRRLCQWNRAALLWAAAERLREEIGAPIPPKDRETHEREVAEVREALGTTALAQHWWQGHAMTMEEAINYALETPGL